MKILVIVESFTKEKTVKHYLEKGFGKNGTKFTVKASGGHICDLVKANMGIDEKTLQPIYAIIKDKVKHVNELKKLVEEHDMLLIASDNDREGEAIAWHLLNVLKPKEYKRIVFNEITENALKEAVNNSRDVDMRMVSSQQARRVLDRLVGYSVTKVLWKYFSGGGLLTAGRVQSVVLKIISEREKDISEFESERYWNMIGNFTNGVEDSKLCKKGVIHKFTKKEDMLNILEKLASNRVYYVISSENKPLNEYPAKPLTTSTLQQIAYTQGFGIKETMKVAQELYEKGHITYMRTDSTNLSTEFVESAKEHITQEFGKEYVNTNVKTKTKQKNAQEAHEAIRPTLFKKNIMKTIERLNSRQHKLYTLIYRHTVAHLMVPAKYDEFTVNIGNKKIDKYEMYFRGKSRELIFPGYLMIYGADVLKNDKYKAKNKIKIEDSNIQATEIRGNCIWTVPPQRYSESSIIKSMEDNGIGRPSTYVSIVKKLTDRNYIHKQDIIGPIKKYKDYVLIKDHIKEESFEKEIYNEKSKFVPSNSGVMINNFLAEKFSNIFNVKFTNNMEESLDLIAENVKTYNDVIIPFNTQLSKKISKLTKIKLEKTNIENEKYEYKINGKEIVVRLARYGPVIQNVTDKTFINLQPYIKLYRMGDLSKIKETDIRFLLDIVQTPRKYKDFCVYYKAYGFYVENMKTKKTRSINKLEYISMLKRDDYTFVKDIKI